jgi:hypothetical protein
MGGSAARTMLRRQSPAARSGVDRVRLDYRRRVPFAQRTTAFIVVFGAVAAVVVGGCGSHREASGFCAEVTRGNAAFDSVDVAGSTRALAQFDRIAESAPATVAPDLKTLSTVLSLLYQDPKAFVKDPANFERYTMARDRIDQYLRRSCGVHIPRRPAG